MELVHKFFEFIKLSFALIKPFPEKDIPDGRDAGKDKTDVVLCAFNHDVCGFLIKVVGLHPAED